MVNWDTVSVLVKPSAGEDGTLHQRLPWCNNMSWPQDGSIAKYHILICIHPQGATSFVLEISEVHSNYTQAEYNRCIVMDFSDRLG